jgi:hypothetical protein
MLCKNLNNSGYMKRIFLALPLVTLVLSSYAQSGKSADYKYGDNAYDLKKVDKIFTRKNTGQQFNQHLNAFRQISASKTPAYVNKTEYKAFLHELEQMPYNGSQQTTQRLQNFVSALSTASSVNMAHDEYRNRLHRIAKPVAIAISEEWGDDIIDVALSDAWGELSPYMTATGKNNLAVATVSGDVYGYWEKDVEIMSANKSQDCTYHVKIDKSLKNDKIQVFFVEQRLSNEIKKLKLYPEERLLEGPMNGYMAYKDESNNLMHFLSNNKTYKMHSAKYMSPKDAPKFDQSLDNNTEWYMYAFRNGYLYYSYMAVPCSHLNTCTLKELLVLEAPAVDPNAAPGEPAPAAPPAGKQSASAAKPAK